MTTELLLYADRLYLSPFVMSAFVSLHEKGLQFRMPFIDLGQRAQHEPEYASLSLNSKVPMLVHDGFALSESSAITEYIDEVFPGTSLYPREPRQKARARQIQSWLRTDLMPLRRARPSTHLFSHVESVEPLTSEAQDAAQRLFAVADQLLAGGFQLFETWSVVDLELALMLNRLALSGDSVPDHLGQYARRHWQRPSAQRWIQLPRAPA